VKDVFLFARYYRTERIREFQNLSDTDTDMTHSHFSPTDHMATCLQSGCFLVIQGRLWERQLKADTDTLTEGRVSGTGKDRVSAVSYQLFAGT